MSYKSSITIKEYGKKSKVAFTSSIVRDNTDSMESFVKTYIELLIRPVFCCEAKQMIGSPDFQKVIDDIYNGG